MEKEILLNLLKEEGYPSHMIETTISKLMNLQTSIKNSFTIWVEKGIIPEIEIEGYSYKKLVNDYGMVPIGAFITLDWLLRDPAMAKKHLARGIK